MPRQSPRGVSVDPGKGSNKPPEEPEAEGAAGTTALGKRIEARMRELGLTKAELARRADVKRWATIHDWITGRQEPRATNLRRLAEALKMDAVSLLDAMLPEPDSAQWREFLARNKDLSFEEIAEARMLARSRPWVTAAQLEAVLQMLRVGKP